MKPNTVRLLLFGAAILFVASILFWKAQIKKKSATPRPAIPATRSLEIAIPPVKATLPTGPETARAQNQNLRDLIKVGRKRLASRSLDTRKCYANPVIIKRKVRICTTPPKQRGKPARRQKCRVEFRKETKMVVGMRRCVGDYLLAVATPTGSISVVEVYERRESSPPGYRG